MGTHYDSATITMGRGESVMEKLKSVLKNQGKKERLDTEYGLLITDVTAKSIARGRTICEVEYQY